MTLRSLTAIAWRDSLVTIFISSSWISLLGDHVAVLDAVAAVAFLIGIGVAGIALLGTFALGVRVLWQAP